MNLNIYISVFIFFCIFTTGAIASNYIYQENGDSYYCDGNVVSPLQFNDSIWTTYANAGMGTTGNCYVNYTKPEFASGLSIWQEKDQPTTNVTVTSSCYSQTPLQFRSQMYWDNINPSLSYVSWSCYNGAGWSALDTNYSTYTAYEEAMFWNTSINSCTNLTMAGTYTLDSDLTGHQAGWNRCLSVHTDNVILDCQGHKIENYTSSGDFVIALGGYENITIKNCIMNNYTYGIYLGNTDNSTIFNNTITNMNGYAMAIVSNADYNNISYNNITNVTTSDGIRVNSNSDFNYIGHNRVNNTPSEFGIALWTNCSNNTVEYNVVDSANIGILTQIGSWYNNISHNTIYDNTQRGMMFLDNASYNTVYNNTFYGAFTQACLLTQRNNTGNIYDSNNLITCGTYGFWELISGGYNNNHTYKNNYIYNSTNGIYSIGGSDLNIYNNTILKTNYGIYATNTTNVNATYNNVTDIVWSGIELQGANNTYLYDNNVSDGYNAVNRSTGFNIDHSNYTYIYDNLFNNLTSGLESIYAEWGGGVRSVVAGHDMEVHDNAVTNSGFGIGISEMSNINVYNNDVSARQFGIWSILSSATNVNIYNNSIHDVRDAIGSGYASLVTYSQNNFYNNTVYNNTYGIRVGYTSSFPYINSNLTNSYNNTVYGNDYGLFVNSNSHDNNFTDDWVYNNSISDVKVVSGYNNRFRNIIIGYDDNKVKSSFDGTNYTIKQVLTSERPPDPYTHRNISKYLNLTNTTDNGWIFLNVSYLDSDVVGLNENSLKFWRNSSGTWTAIGDGVNTANNYVYVNISSSEFGSIFAPLDDDPYAINSCGSINSSGYYYMTNNINGNITGGNCLTINGTNIILDCAGYNMTGTLPRSPPYTIGIFGQNTSNVTIKNCFVSNYHQGLRFDSSPYWHNNTLLYNNTFYNTTIGAGAYSGNYTNFTNNTFINISQTALGIGSYSYFCIVQENVIYGQGGGIQLSNVFDSLITRNHEYLHSSVGSLIMSGARNNVTYNTIHDHTDSNALIYIQQSGSDNNTIAHNILYNSPYYAIRLEQGNYNTVYNNTITNTSRGIFAGSGGYHNITSNNIINSSQYGIYVTSANNNFAYNNVTGSASWDVSVSGAINNTFIDNTIGKDDYSVLASFSGNNFNIKELLTASRPLDPYGYINISKYLNMTNSTSTGTIAINISYSDSDIGVINENSLRFWRNSSGTWTNVGDAVYPSENKVGVNLSASEFGSIFAPMGSDKAITNCNSTISSSGEWFLLNDINVTSDGYTTTNACIDINSNDVILDCNGYDIIGNDTDTTYGIFSNQYSNITIKNCSIYSFTNGIDFNDVNSSVIDNNTVYLNNNRGISVNSGKDNNVTNNDVYDNDKIGIYYNSSYNSIIDNNDVYNNSVSCSPSPSPSCCGIGGNHNATIINNRIHDNNNGDGITLNGDYNTIRNNTFDNNADSIYVFWLSEYNLIDSNTFTDNVGGAIYFNYDTHYNNVTSNNISNCTAYCIFLSGSPSYSTDNYLVKNNTINATGSNQGIYLYEIDNAIVDNNTLYGSTESIRIQDVNLVNITNNIINATNIGIGFQTGINIITENNTVYDGVQSIYTYNVDNSIIRYNNVYEFSNQGIHLTYNSDNNIVTENNVSSGICNYAGIHINGSSVYNNVTYNNIYASNNFGIEISSNNHNTIANNYVVNTTNNVINTDSSDDTTVENNYIEIKSPNMIGIVFVGTTPQNNIARNNTVIGQSSGQLGILAHRCDGCLFDSNDVSNLSSQGIAVDVESKDCNITNNYVHDGSGIGIQAYSYSYAPVTNIIIQGNNITNVGGIGVHMNTANNSRIEYNTILNESVGNDNHAVLLSNSNDTIINNNYIENYGFGIDVRGSSDPNQVVSFNNTVENNYVEPNIDNIAYGQYGVGVCCGASGTRVINNTALHTDYGINVWWYNVDDTLVENNTVYDCPRQIDVRGDVSPSPSDMLSGVIVRGNTFYDTNLTRNYGVLGLYLTNVSDMLIENNTWTNLSTYAYPSFAYFDQPIIFGNGADNFDNITLRYNNVTHSALGMEIQTGSMTNTKIHDNYFETDVYGIGLVFSCMAGTCVNDSIYNNVMTGNTETFLSSGYVSTGDNSPIEVYNNTMYNNQWGIRLGLTAFAYQPTTNTIFHNNTIYNNTVGIYINSGSYNNTFSYDWIFNNTDWDVQVLHGTNTLNFIKLGSNANEMTIDSVIASNVSFKDVKIGERYSDPPSYKNISRYINATNNSISNFLTLNMSYDDADWISAGIYNDTFLGMWKNSGTGWIRLPSTVDTTNNYVYANLSNNFSQMTILGDTIIDVDGDGYLNTVDCDDFNYTIRPVDNNTWYSLNTNLTICTGNYYNVSFAINSNDIILDCNNSVIESDPTQDFIDIYISNNTKVLNCNNFGAGMSIRMSYANNSLIRNNTLYTNSFGINMEDSYDNSFENNTIYDSLTAIRNTASLNNLFTYTLIGYSGIEVLTTTFEGFDYTIQEVPVLFRPPLFNTTDADYRDIGKFLEISSMTASSWIDINYKYDDADFYNSNITFEDRINMWRYDGANWNNITASTIDTVNNIVYSSNITNFSIFAPLGEEYYTCGFQNLASNTYMFPYQFNVTVGSYEDVILEYNGQNYSYLSGNLSNDGNTFYYDVYQQDTYGITPYKWYCNNSVGVWNSTSTQHWLFDLPSFWELAIILAVLFIAGIFAYLSVKMDKEEHGHIQMLLTLMSIIMLVVGVAITMMIAEQKGQTVIKDILSGGAYMPMIIIVIVVTFSLLIKFLVDIFRMYKVNPSKKTRSR